MFRINTKHHHHYSRQAEYHSPFEPLKPALKMSLDGGVGVHLLQKSDTESDGGMLPGTQPTWAFAMHAVQAGHFFQGGNERLTGDGPAAKNVRLPFTTPRQKSKNHNHISHEREQEGPGHIALGIQPGGQDWHMLIAKCKGDASNCLQGDQAGEHKSEIK